MNKYLSAICWAAVILAVALAGRFGLMDEDSTTTLLIALPFVGWMALRGRCSCALREEA